MKVLIKRAYEAPAARDGTRVLVDRLWPRGLTKDAARIDAWLKEVAPSTALRRWFGHEPAKFDEFRRRYRKEPRRVGAARGARALRHAHARLFGEGRAAQQRRRAPAAARGAVGDGPPRAVAAPGARVHRLRRTVAARSPPGAAGVSGGAAAAGVTGARAQGARARRSLRRRERRAAARVARGLARETFYDARRVAIVPMAFCYPGTGPSGDLPPPPECARRWRAPLLALLPNLELTVVIGSHALAYHDGAQRQRTLTEAARDWRRHWPDRVVLPHPSPRNNRWLARNPWFEAELVPRLQARVREVLAAPA